MEAPKLRPVCGIDSKAPRCRACVHTLLAKGNVSNAAEGSLMFMALVGGSRRLIVDSCTTKVGERMPPRPCTALTRSCVMET